MTSAATPRHTGTPSPPEVAFVLSGGGNAGAAQVGMLRALFETGIRPDVVVGCSIGAINAAYLAIDPSPERLDRMVDEWLTVRSDELFPGSKARHVARLVTGRAYLCDPAGLRQCIRSWMHPLRDLADTAIPVHVVTTDLETGRPVWWSSGDPVDVLAASACLPGIFPPVRLFGRQHIDGGVTVPLPLDRALALGARRVYVLDATARPDPPRRRLRAVDVLLSAWAISRAQLIPDCGDGDPRVVVLPRTRTGKLDLADFSRTDELMRSAYHAARAFLTGEHAAADAGLARRGPHRLAA